MDSPRDEFEVQPSDVDQCRQGIRKPSWHAPVVEEVDYSVTQAHVAPSALNDAVSYSAE